MADDVLASFFVALGWKNDDAAQKKVMSGVAAAEKVVTEAEKRVVAARLAAAKSAEDAAVIMAEADLHAAQEAMRAAKQTEAAAEKVAQAKRREVKESAEAIALAITKLNLFVDAAISAGQKIGGAIGGAITGMSQLYYVSGRTGASVESIKNLGHAFGQVGGSAGQAVSALESFAKGMRTNEGLAGFVKDLGIDGTKDKALQLLDVVDRLKKEGYQVGSQQAEMLGIDEGTFNLLSQYGDQVRHFYAERKKAAKDFNLDEQEAARASARLMQGLGSLSATVEVGFTKLLTSASPRLSKWIDDLKVWIQTHQKEIGEFLQWIAEKAEWLGQKIDEFVEGMAGTLKDKEKQKAFDEWKEGFTGIGDSVKRLIGLSKELTESPLWKLLKALTIDNPLATWPSTLLGKAFGTAQAAEAGGGGGGYGTPGAPAEDKRTWLQRNLPKGLGGKDAPSPTGGVPIGSSAGNLTKLIDEEAKRAGVDPRIMHGIRAGESHRRADYDVKSDSSEDSYGPFQLNRRGGLGAKFEKETGLDLHDPRTIPAQARWVAQHIKERMAADPNYNPGSEWYGYKGLQDANPKWGDSGYAPSGGVQSSGDTPSSNGVGGVDQRQGGAQYRRQKISAELNRQLAAAGVEAGVNAEIYSGGQDESGLGHTGSHRHDHGGAADLRLYVIGPDGKKRYLDMTSDADRPTMEKFLRSAVKHGATGIGAGPGYMGGRTNMHVGGGSEGAWGAGGSSANAPDWVQRALREGIRDRAKSPAVLPKPVKSLDFLHGPGGFDVNARLQPTVPPGSGTVTNSNTSTANTLHQTNNYNVDIKDSRDPHAHAKAFKDTSVQMGQLHLENAQRAFA